VVYADGSMEPPDEVSDYIQTGRPGHRAPHVWLRDGRSTLDLFGRGFVLLRFAADGKAAKTDFCDTARERGVPLEVVDLSQEVEARKVYGADNVLVRPDGHVAWRGNALPDNVEDVIDTVRGFGGARDVGADDGRSCAKTSAVPAASAG
jgi:hypothetical protein